MVEVVVGGDVVVSLVVVVAVGVVAVVGLVVEAPVIVAVVVVVVKPVDPQRAPAPAPLHFLVTLTEVTTNLFVRVDCVRRASEYTFTRIRFPSPAAVYPSA